MTNAIHYSEGLMIIPEERRDRYMQGDTWMMRASFHKFLSLFGGASEPRIQALFRHFTYSQLGFYLCSVPPWHVGSLSLSYWTHFTIFFVLCFLGFVSFPEIPNRCSSYSAKSCNPCALKSPIWTPNIHLSLIVSTRHKKRNPFWNHKRDGI